MSATPSNGLHTHLPIEALRALDQRGRALALGALIGLPGCREELLARARQRTCLDDVRVYSIRRSNK